jgi:SAM-dependent methyltransferase
MPPLELVARVGVADGVDPLRFYLEEGARLRGLLDELLPPDWSWENKRVLDFGCGSARVLRHFAAEATRGEFIGSDIDEPTIAWAQGHLSPPFQFIRNELAPPLVLDTASLDLIMAMSVFTHIDEGWAAWLGEMHRLLAPDGLLLASFLGEGMWEALVEQPYSEDAVGMAVLRAWDHPYAWVFHSEWWLREHWGRGFEVLRVKRPERSAAGGPEITHSYILLRKRDVQLEASLFERLDPREQRELAGLQTSLRLARKDIGYLREQLERPGPSPSRRGFRKASRRRLGNP